MTVKHDKGIFSIDGVPVINPKFFISQLGLQYGFWRPLENGDSWDLPENIIAEKEKMPSVTVRGHGFVNTSGGKEVYRLKLKEPLVDTGSKDMLIKYLRNAEWLLDGNFNTNVIDALNQIRQAIEIVTRK